MAQGTLTRILIVDDEAGIRALIRDNLEEMGYSCCEAGNGRDALEAISSGPIDLAIIDVMMPGMNGLTLFHRALELDPDLAVVFVTAVDDVTVMTEYLKKGAYDYMVKPVRRKRLKDSVEDALHRRDSRLEEKRQMEHLEQVVAFQAEALRNRLREITALNRWIQSDLERGNTKGMEDSV